MLSVGHLYARSWRWAYSWEWRSGWYARVAMASRRELGPWLWGINGAMSVFACVLAALIAIAAGISASFWTGVELRCGVGQLRYRGTA